MSIIKVDLVVYLFFLGDFIMPLYSMASSVRLWVEFALLTYGLVPPLLIIVYLVTRPSAWLYRYASPWVVINIFGPFRPTASAPCLDEDRDHRLEYGRPLKSTVLRFWWYSLIPFGCFFIMLVLST